MSEVTRRALLQAGAVAATGTVPLVGDAAAATAAMPKAPTPVVRERLLMDFGWRFHLGHACDPAKDFGFGADLSTFAKSGEGVADAAAADFDDTAWASINLPHDWAVALPAVPSATLSPDDPRATHGFKPLGRQFPETSIGWYRRGFDLPASDAGRRLALEFDGVFRDCLVMLNGFIVGRNESGYAPFRIDITDYANCGGRNLLAVRVDATLGEGWFYEGAGIYRHVWLTRSDPLHIPQWGVAVRSAVAEHAATLAIDTDLVNEDVRQRTARIVSTVVDQAGNVVARSTSHPVTLATGAQATVAQSLAVAAPRLWSPDAPHLYRLMTQIVEGQRVVDDDVTTFGIRTIRFDAENGFFLNGEPFKLQGTCNHQDFAGVGTALPDRLHAYRVEALKAMGSNGFRCAHNPPAPELLDACDRLGMLVIDETRRMASDKEGLGELARMIRRDRNHPSVILWSIGNEEHAEQGLPVGARVGDTMRRLALSLDPTRPLTAAMDDAKSWGLGVTAALDVMGTNYRTDKLPAFHAAHPAKALVCTEISSSIDARGVYVKDPASGYGVAYDTEFPWWGSSQEAAWTIVAAHRFISGGFVWSGFDYRGEPAPKTVFPQNSSQYGLMDSCGFPKDNYYYYRAWWHDAPSLHLFPHWNWAGREGQNVSVWCHTNCDSVELFLNGVSQGVRSVPRNGHAEWSVPYASGVIEARGYRGGQLALTDRRETTGTPAKILVSADRTVLSADGEDIAVLRVAIADAQGRVVPTAGNRVAFDIAGPGRIIGVGNGDPASLESDVEPVRSAFNGLCAAIVQTTKTFGAITLTARADGLIAGTISLDVHSAVLRAALP